MTHLPKNTQRGFSLTELLVVAFIVTVVATTAVLNSTAILPNYKANSAMNQVLGQLRAARQQAISHRREVQVQFLGNNQIKLSELVLKGVAPPPVTVTSAIYFGGQTGGPPLMKFTTNGSFIDAGNTLVNGTVFLASRRLKAAATSTPLTPSRRFSNSRKFCPLGWLSPMTLDSFHRRKQMTVIQWTCWC